jgi:hypothetical protein
MRSSAGVDTTVVGGGTYTLSAPIALTSADNGSSFVEAAGQNAIISGGGRAIQLFTVSGASNITIKGLTLQGTTSTAQEAEDAQAAINIFNSSAIAIDGNAFTGIPKGVLIDDLTHHVTVSGNSFLNIGSSAVEMTPTSHENTVANNTMTHIGYQWSFGGAVQMVESWGNLITHNLIQDMPRFGVEEQNYTTAIKSGGNTIEYNKILHSGQTTSDVGAIYAFSSEDGAHLGDTIRYNRIEDTGPNLSWGVYLDDYTNNAKVYGNFVAGTTNGGVMLHGGNGNEVFNNVLIGNKVFGIELLEIERTMSGTSIHNNDGTYAQWRALGGDAGSDIVTTAGFTDPPAGNYSFVSGAFALTQGIPQLPWSSMGLTGSAQPPPAQVTIDTLVLQLSEDYYQGNAKFIVKMDGKQIGGPTEVTARHSSGATQSFSFQADWTSGKHQVEVDFINDLYGGTTTTDRNLWIDNVAYDGKSYGPASDAPLYWNTAFTISVGQS